MKIIVSCDVLSQVSEVSKFDLWTHDIVSIEYVSVAQRGKKVPVVRKERKDAFKKKR